MAVVGLPGGGTLVVKGERGWAGNTCVKSALELTVAPELNADDLVNEEAHQVQRLRYWGTLVRRVGHCDG